jgi:ABC-type amino acid transport substrate-binding protein
VCSSSFVSQKKVRQKEKKIMRKLLFPLFSLFMLASLVLAACGTPVAATPITVEVTRIVTSEAPAAEEPAATEPPATGDATPTTAAAEQPAPPVAGGERLQAILDRGQLICGVHGTFQGFGFVESDGSWTGFDVPGRRHSSMMRTP